MIESLPLLFSCLFLGTLFSAALGSMFGLGGGVLIIPIFHFLLKMPLPVTIGISAVCVFTNSLLSSIRNYANRRIHFPLSFFLIPAVFIGSWAGGISAEKISSLWVYRIFGTALLSSAVYMLVQGIHPKFKKRTEADSWKINQIPSWRFGLGIFAFTVAGWVASVLGTGAGVLKVPALDFILQVPFKISAATSSFVTMFSILNVLYRSVENGVYQDYGFHTIVSVLGAVVGSQIGIRFLYKWPVSFLRLLFGIFLAGFGTYAIFWNL